MKGVLEEISLRANKNMPEEAAEVLTKLCNVEHFHFECDIIYFWQIVAYSEGAAKSTQPSGHEVCSNEYLIGPGRTDKIVNDRISPFN